MPTLYVTRPGVLRFGNNCFVAETKGAAPVAVPQFRVERVVVFGPVHITYAAVSHVLAKRIEVCFLSRFGVPRGRLCPADDARSDVRLAQFRALSDEAFRLRVSRCIVSAKLRNCRQVVMRYSRNHQEAELRHAIVNLKQQSVRAAEASGIEQLRGIEGSAARTYFAAFGTMVGSDALFDGRSRRPPRDPANAVLSLGYTLLGGELTGVLAAHGLDPYLGIYHSSRRGVPALAQDILEEFRAPVVDRLVLAMLNRKELTAEDFAAGTKGGLRLKDKPLKVFLLRYEESLNETFKMRDGSRRSFRQLVAEQARRLRRACETLSDYQPFVWERG